MTAAVLDKTWCVTSFQTVFYRALYMETQLDYLFPLESHGTSSTNFMTADRFHYRDRIQLNIQIEIIVFS